MTSTDSGRGPEPMRLDGQPLTDRGARTRRNILAAAEQVFGELGFHDASIVKITEKAGVAQGTFYIYFESKQQVFDELVRDLNRRVRQTVSEHSEGARNRADRERLGFAAYFRFVASHPGIYRIIRQAEIVSPQVLREHYEAVLRGYVTGLDTAVARGEISPGDSEVRAWMLMGIGEMIGMRWVLWEESSSVPDEVLEEMLRFITAGLEAREG